MQLTILGNAAGAPGPDGACPGYLVESDETAVLIDCGPGVTGKLVAHRPAHTLSAVILSHLHLDHIHDLPVLLLKRWMERAAACRREGKAHELASAPDLPIYLPPGGVAYLEGMLAAQGHTRDDEKRGGVSTMLDGVTLHDYDPTVALVVGELSIAFVGPTRHFPGDCYAMRITDRTGTVFAYSGDTAPDDLIVRIARDADLFLCEATLTGTDGQTDGTGRHLTAREAGAYATQADARSLLLTHILIHDEPWYAAMRDAARATFAGTIAIAHVGHAFPVATMTPVKA